MLLTLTCKEFLVLELLVAHQRTTVSRADLIEYGWGDDPASNVLDGVIVQLRRKLRDPPMIHTVPRLGYRIDPA